MEEDRVEWLKTIVFIYLSFENDTWTLQLVPYQRPANDTFVISVGDIAELCGSFDRVEQWVLGLHLAEKSTVRLTQMLEERLSVILRTAAFQEA